MSLPRGSHSNCGSQPSGWEPFFFTLKQPALVFPHQEISSDSSLLRAPSPAQVVLCKSAYAVPESLIGRLAFSVCRAPWGFAARGK